MAKKTKSIVAIATVCLLVALSILPCFALSSDSSIQPYTPRTELAITLQYATINSDFDTPLHHIPLRYTVGNYGTEGDVLSHSNTAGFRSETFITMPSTPNFNDKWVQTSQSTISDIVSYDYDDMYLTVTLRDLYIFDDVNGIDTPMHGSTPISESCRGYINLLNDYWLFYCPPIDSDYAYTKLRYREAGQDLYTTTEILTTGLFDLHDLGDPEPPIDDPTYRQISLGDFTNLAIFEEGKIYHVDYLEVTALVTPYYLSNGDPNPLRIQSLFDYVDINGIDNAMVTIDKTNIWLPVRDFTSWMATATTGFFSAEIAPGFPIGGIVIMLIAFAIVIWFLKMFAGG